VFECWTVSNETDMSFLLDCIAENLEDDEFITRLLSNQQKQEQVRKWYDESVKGADANDMLNAPLDLLRSLSKHLDRQNGEKNGAKLILPFWRSRCLLRLLSRSSGAFSISLASAPFTDSSYHFLTCSCFCWLLSSLVMNSSSSRFSAMQSSKNDMSVSLETVQHSNTSLTIGPGFRE
jgi:hypothetical protein